ncbi:MAG TPA: hypothetical protein PLD46_03340 [Hyphomicrobium sp.]|nr:hypothetical protein [Hyphomicrobium sp.]
MPTKVGTHDKPAKSRLVAGGSVHASTIAVFEEFLGGLSSWMLACAGTTCGNGGHTQCTRRKPTSPITISRDDQREMPVRLLPLKTALRDQDRSRNANIKQTTPAVTRAH